MADARLPSVRATEPCSTNSRKSESEDDELESPTTHCFVLGTKPRRILSRRPVSTDVLHCLDVETLKLFMNGHKRTITPPRSQSAVDFRHLAARNAKVEIPHLGTRRIFTPSPPPLTLLYAPRASGDCMDLDQTTSRLSPVQQTGDMELDQKPGFLKPVDPTATNKPVILSQDYKGTGRYSTDDEMHTSGIDEEILGEQGPASFFNSLRKRYSTCLSTPKSFVSAKFLSQRDLAQLARPPPLHKP
ncbi:SubName: Full=Uncharacterized protein {ECO:0000313/EMBL:CCA72863.1} [Serendipita indica DSM 11827]|nr:SubName: Full=Uncharacterized protein {ECO:0000313/EMBL:CCA72863.1} [Serendipita indica DSM 11827]